ncbi:hypothetical protein, partial [Escherichia coli]|uniref:hypothetical protein n=1 Tax=Escherichia coli TaxID=562 RepID=UPI00227F53BB
GFCPTCQRANCKSNVNPTLPTSATLQLLPAMAGRRFLAIHALCHSMSVDIAHIRQQNNNHYSDE